MRVRKPADMRKVLTKKGFVELPAKKKNHHIFYYLTVDGMMTDIYTYFSHGKSSDDYGKGLMGEIKKQLRFDNVKDAENFFDCTLTKDGYIEKLKNNGSI